MKDTHFYPPSIYGVSEPENTEFLTEPYEKNPKEKKNVMTRDELIRCVELLRNGTTAEQEAAMSEILIRNEPYIKSLIRKFYPTYAVKYMEDMVSCGYIGIICALSKANPPYDPTRTSFTTFVSKYIIHEISDCISQMVHNTSPHYSATSKKINRAISVLQQRGIAKPTLSDIMRETKLGSEAIQTVLLMQSANAALPLDHPNVMDLPAGEQESPLEAVERLELLDDLQNAMNRLPEKERRVLELQYGLNGEDRYTQAQIAKMLGPGITVNQVHRLRANAYRKLYHDPKLRGHYEHEYRKQEKEYTLLVEQTIVPIIISAGIIEREILALEDIPIEEISI